MVLVMVVYWSKIHSSLRCKIIGWLDAHPLRSLTVCFHEELDCDPRRNPVFVHLVKNELIDNELGVKFTLIIRKGRKITIKPLLSLNSLSERVKATSRRGWRKLPSGELTFFGHLHDPPIKYPTFRDRHVRQPGRARNARNKFNSDTYILRFSLFNV